MIARCIQLTKTHYHFETPEGDKFQVPMQTIGRCPLLGGYYRLSIDINLCLETKSDMTWEEVLVAIPNEDTKRRVETYQEMIRLGEKHLEEVRKDCPHKEWGVAMYAWRPGAMQPQRICTTCGGIVQGVTEEEMKKCWEEWEMPKTQAGYDTIVKESRHGRTTKASSTENS